MRKWLKALVVVAALVGVGVALRRVLGGGRGEVLDLTDQPAGGPRRREVTATGKADGHIATLAGPWGTVSRDDAIEHIRSGEFEYFVAGAGDYRLQVVEPTRGGAYLRTEPGGGLSNNLDQLPDA